MKYRRFLSLISCLLLAGLVLPSCTPGGGSPDETAAPTGEVTSGNEDVTRSEAPTETQEETKAEPETFPDAYIQIPISEGYAEYEKTRVDVVPEPEVVRVEAEHYNDTTLKLIKQSGKEFSGGSCIYSMYSPTDFSDLYVEYIVEVTQDGLYDLTALSLPTGQDWSTDYSVSVNDGGTCAKPADYVLGGGIESPTFNNNNLFRFVKLGKVQLEAGMNLIRLTMDPNDRRPADLGQSLAFYLDYIEVSLSVSSGNSISVSYDCALPGADKELLAGAAAVNVFDASYPVKLAFSTPVKANAKVPYTVTDYFGRIVFEGQISGGDGLVTLTKGVRSHPVGYFTAKVGTATLHYVVTPPLHTKAFEDSPFAMDFAAYYLIKNPQKTYQVAAAARLMGVTWVRERANWTDYERTQGQYDFSSTEPVFSMINAAGLNNLAMLCNAPSWAKKNYTGTGGLSVGGFRDSQAAAYAMTRALAAHYNGVVQAWELWNEPDIGGLYAEPAELYAAWYKAAALGVIDSGADVKISMAGLCFGTTNDYMSLLMQNDLLPYTHVFNFHQHTPFRNSFVNFMSGNMTYYAASLPAYTTEDKPIWVSEAGMKLDFTNGSHQPTDAQLSGQVPYLITSAAQSLASGTDKHFWFVLAPYIEEGGDFGTFSADLEPYPTAAAEAVMTTMLGKAEYIGTPLGLPSKCEGLLFDTGRGMTAVLWSQANKSSKFTFASQYPVIVTDLMGGQTTVVPVEGQVTVTLTQSPVYVSYKAAPAYAPQGNGISLPGRLSVTEGQRVLITPTFDVIRLDTDKTQGHEISDGYTLRLRLLNLNDHEVSGFVDGFMTGLTVTKSDAVVIPAMGEATLTVVLHTSDAPLNGYLHLNGHFAGEDDLSVSVCHVYNAAGKDNARGTVTIKTPRSEGSVYASGKQPDLIAEVTDLEGTPAVWVNGKPITGFTAEKKSGVLTVTIPTASWETGRYFVSIGVLPESGEYRFDCTWFIIE